MARRRQNELVRLEFYTWRIGPTRNGVFTADGRTNKIDVGRHSLNTRDRSEALQRLQQLDRQMAVRFGLLQQEEKSFLPAQKAVSIEVGIKMYLDHVGRSPAMGGAKPGTRRRYKAVFDAFSKVMKDRGITCWHQVRNQQLEQFGNWLEENDYAIAGQYLMITTVKQAIRWLVKNQHLPESHRVDVQVKKSNTTTTYCYTREQVTAMIDHCLAGPTTVWLGRIIVGLAHTGLRISELAALRWSDLDFAGGLIHLPDHSLVGTATERAAARTTKGHRSRVIPIHEAILSLVGAIKRRPDGRVFQGPRGGAVKPDVVRVALLRDVIQPLANRFPSVPGEPGFVDGRVHSFRHYFCSLCADGDVPELMLMDWLGHRDSRMVKRYYHGSRDEARKRLNAIKFTDSISPSKADGSASASAPAGTHGQGVPPEVGDNNDKPESA